jgi:zinc protease
MSSFLSFPKRKKIEKTMSMLRRKFLIPKTSMLWISIFLILVPASSWSTLLKNQPEKVTLANGLTLIYQKDDSSATSVVQILIQGGKSREPRGMEGLALLTTRLCLELPDQTVLERMMIQATRTTMICREDFSIVKISCLSENLEEAIKLSTQIFREPLFSGLRIDRIKEMMGHQRKQQDDEPINTAHNEALDRLFNETSYAGPAYGSEESLKKIKKQDIESFYHDAFRAGNMIVAISTDLDKDKALGILQPYFMEFAEGKFHETEPISLPPIEEKNSFIEKDSQQSLVYMAFPLPNISPRNFILATMIQNLLGRGIGSKLWPLRTEKKLAYNVNARAFSMKGGGILEAYLETGRAKTQIAIQELKKTIQDLYENGISAGDLDITKAHSQGAALRENETKDEKTYSMATMEALGLGYDFLIRIASEIEATTLEEFNTFIRDVLDPEKAVEIVIGPRELDSAAIRLP